MAMVPSGILPVSISSLPYFLPLLLILSHAPRPRRSCSATQLDTAQSRGFPLQGRGGRAAEVLTESGATSFRLKIGTRATILRMLNRVFEIRVISGDHAGET